MMRDVYFLASWISLLAWRADASASFLRNLGQQPRNTGISVASASASAACPLFAVHSPQNADDKKRRLRRDPYWCPNPRDRMLYDLDRGHY
jgi:hypothetical protein